AGFEPAHLARSRKARRILPPHFVRCPRQDSNLRTSLRRRVLYPLSYGGRSATNLKPRVLLFGRVANEPQGTALSRGSAVCSVSIESMAGKRILACDDDPLILRLLQVNLEIEDYDVLLAHDGLEACEIAEAEHPDLILLDIMMPRMDGYEACKRLKATDSVKDIPVVFLSAKAQQEDIEEGTALGAAAYITKPFEPDQLVKVIESLVSPA
ncbi:MAG: hypothetical protein QOH90_2419, partial [Actinomycetota bacterium]|nr:hypothetical protein [Actinomycetota bacterium]